MIQYLLRFVHIFKAKFPVSNKKYYYIDTKETKSPESKNTSGDLVLFGFQKIRDLLRNGALAGVGTLGIAAIHLGKQFTLCLHRHHAAVIHLSAIAAEKRFSLHYASSICQPIGDTVTPVSGISQGTSFRFT